MIVSMDFFLYKREIRRKRKRRELDNLDFRHIYKDQKQKSGNLGVSADVVFERSKLKSKTKSMHFHIFRDERTIFFREQKQKSPIL